MLQTAAAAAADDASDDLIVAALLHDYGHLIHDGDVDAAERGVDTEHEEVARRFLGAYFPASVVEPVRLHVDAKRYLCAVDASYRKRLSPASQLSLELQGGPMSAAEVVPSSRPSSTPRQPAGFVATTTSRRPTPDADPPDLERYRPLLLAALRRDPDGSQDVPRSPLPRVPRAPR